LETELKVWRLHRQHIFVKRQQPAQGAGWWRGVHRKRRERRPLPGMLLHIDASRHQWFQDERWYDLIVTLDDATSQIYSHIDRKENRARVDGSASLLQSQLGLSCK
jgi:hypothetical protein